jgi:hypothetical protein
MQQFRVCGIDRASGLATDLVVEGPGGKRKTWPDVQAHGFGTSFLLRGHSMSRWIICLSTVLLLAFTGSAIGAETPNLSQLDAEVLRLLCKNLYQKVDTLTAERDAAVKQAAELAVVKEQVEVELTKVKEELAKLQAVAVPAELDGLAQVTYSIIDSHVLPGVNRSLICAIE